MQHDSELTKTIQHLQKNRDEEESSDEETDLRPLHEEFFITNQSDKEEPDEPRDTKKKNHLIT